jgi:hypothetical protein
MVAVRVLRLLGQFKSGAGGNQLVPAPSLNGDAAGLPRSASDPIHGETARRRQTQDLGLVI